MVKGSPHDVSDGTKPCPRCNERKPLSEFPKNKRMFHGINSYCKPCTNAMQQERRATPEGAQAHRKASKKWREENNERHRDNNARWKYGVDHGTYETMLAAQGGKCAICGTAEPGTRVGRFAIDHCHGTQKVRGLLCASCNNGLGRFRDDPSRLLAAATYLESFLSEGGTERASAFNSHKKLLVRNQSPVEHLPPDDSELVEGI